MVGEEGLEPSRVLPQQILSLQRLPIPPLARVVNGGTYQIRTGVHGFADRCVTTPPTRRGIIISQTLLSY